MPAINISTDWVSGNLVIYDKDKNIIATINGTTGVFALPSGAITVNGVALGSAVIADVTASAAEINKLAGLATTKVELGKLSGAGAVVASGASAAHITDLKADYIVTDIDDAGTIDGTEIAVVLNLLAARCNALVARFEAFGINAAV